MLKAISNVNFWSDNQLITITKWKIPRAKTNKFIIWFLSIKQEDIERGSVSGWWVRKDLPEIRLSAKMCLVLACCKNFWIWKAMDKLVAYILRISWATHCQHTGILSILSRSIRVACSQSSSISAWILSLTAVYNECFWISPNTSLFFNLTIPVIQIQSDNTSDTEH